MEMMMINFQSSPFSCPSSSTQKLEKINTCPNKLSTQFSLPTKFPLLPNDQRTVGRDHVGRTSVLYNGYPYFPAPRHPLEAELLKPVPQQSGHGKSSSGIGILEFFEGKNIFVTGGTGLVGKAFIEKLLRTTSVNKIYILIKAEDKQAALDRLTREIIDSELFKRLRERYGNYYQAFVRGKLIPVAGNMLEANLGMDSSSAQSIMGDVDVIVESAASTSLNDRYDDLLESNTNAPQRLMRFAKACKNLKLFVHFSTAYVNGRKEGLIFEKPMTMGENGRKGDHHDNGGLPRLDLADEISLAMKACRAATHDDATKDLKKLGLERANFFGWYNTYHMTKAMGEMVLNEIREDIPVLIMRPSVIESSYREPFPGWIQGNRMFDPVIISYGKGQLPGFLADPQAYMDIVPVDMVVNSTIAAIAKHGNINKPQLEVYHVATGVANPLRFSNFFDIIHEYFSRNPLFKDGKGISKIKCFDDFDNFSKFTRTQISKRNGTSHQTGVDKKNMLQKLQKQSKAKVAYAEQLCKMYEFIGFFQGRFDTGNTQKLLQEMSKEEQMEFDIDATNINWTKYFREIHIPGLRKHIINGHKISV